MDEDEVLTEEEREIIKPTLYHIPRTGLEFIQHQEESQDVADKVIQHILKNIDVTIEEKELDRDVPRFLANHFIACINTMLEWSFPSKDLGEPDYFSDSSWNPGVAPLPPPIDSSACGSLPIRYEIPPRPPTAGSELSQTHGSQHSRAMSKAVSSQSKKKLNSTLPGNQLGGTVKADASKQKPDEKRGAKIVVRMAKPVQERALITTAGSSNEAIRAAVELEKKKKDEAKLKISQLGRLEQEKASKIKAQYRGKAITIEDGEVVLLRQVNPEKLKDFTAGPNLVKDEEPAPLEEKKKKTKTTRPLSSAKPLQKTQKQTEKDSKQPPVTILGEKDIPPPFRQTDTNTTPLIDSIKLQPGASIRVAGQTRMGAPLKKEEKKQKGAASILKAAKTITRADDASAKPVEREANLKTPTLEAEAPPVTPTGTAQKQAAGAVSLAADNNQKMKPAAAAPALFRQTPEKKEREFVHPSKQFNEQILKNQNWGKPLYTNTFQETSLPRPRRLTPKLTARHRPPAVGRYQLDTIPADEEGDNIVSSSVSGTRGVGAALTTQNNPQAQAQILAYPVRRVMKAQTSAGTSLHTSLGDTSTSLRQATQGHQNRPLAEALQAIQSLTVSTRLTDPNSFAPRVKSPQPEKVVMAATESGIILNDASILFG
ncbi:hypothetical protein BLNAU_5684 [Blattamonas nauphoetae]|uniref:Uncharacterized protein n=1 Tax=Blattamonas nauphoetae TaxID=2049346 RepID=A0ABQ9Y6Q4_9EUKA|nr:hypothetical protein BLNAU_5684 [Blattamonas nauphoetae]